MPYSRLSTGRPELDVRVDRVVALVLQAVGADLVADADAAALVAAQVDDHAEALLGDPLHRRVELHAAVAAQRPEHVTGQALAVHPRRARRPRPQRRPRTNATCCSPSSSDSYT